MNIPYVKIFPDFISVVEAMDNGERGKFLMALMQYINGREVDKLSGAPLIAYIVMKNQIDRDVAEYEKTSKRQQENGSKGGRPQNPKNPLVFSEDSQNPKNPLVFSETQHNPEKEEEEEKEKEKDNGVCVNSISSNRARARKDTHTPTRDEIHAFCVENGISIDEEKFYLTYSSNGWKDTNGNPVGDWRNRVLLWNHGDKERKAAGGKRTANDNSFSTFDTDEFLGLALKRTFHEE